MLITSCHTDETTRSCYSYSLSILIELKVLVTNDAIYTIVLEIVWPIKKKRWLAQKEGEKRLFLKKGTLLKVFGAAGVTTTITYKFKEKRFKLSLK